MKTQVLFGFGLISALVVGTNASAKVVDVNRQYATSQMEEMTIEDARNIQILENDIRILDAEIKKCESSKKGWIAGTVIGSAGVLATGIAAIVQGVQISDTKKATKEARDKTTELNNAAENMNKDQ